MPIGCRSELSFAALLLAACCLAGCAPRPQYRSGYVPKRGATQQASGGNFNQPAKPVGRQGQACSGSLSAAEKAELFRQFDGWRDTGGAAPRQMADARGNCIATP